MKKSRVLGLLLSMSMLCATLTGCMGVDNKLVINPDGSGVLTGYMGFTEEGIKQLELVGEDLNAIGGLDKKFEYNGKTYYGNTAEKTFNNIDELNEIFSGDDADFDALSVNMSSFSIEEIEDGFMLTIDMGDKPVNEEVVELYAKNIADVNVESEDELKEIMDEMVVLFEINTPNGTIFKADNKGMPDGITQSEDKVILDFMKLANVDFSKYEEPTICFNIVFPDEKGEISVPGVQYVPFDDVTEKDWFCVPVETLAYEGIVNGIGDRRFNPNGTLTYAQFCQMIYNTTGINPLVEHDYWAYTAVENCVNNKFIKSLGDITPENYDKPINREEAVVGLLRVIKSDMNFGKPYNSFNKVKYNYGIPDIKDITPSLVEEVREAYLIGLTKGSDSLGTFYPKRNLTRAEMCQLFYNIMEFPTQEPNGDSPAY